MAVVPFDRSVLKVNQAILMSVIVVGVRGRPRVSPGRVGAPRARGDDAGGGGVAVAQRAPAALPALAQAVGHRQAEGRPGGSGAAPVRATGRRGVPCGGKRLRLHRHPAGRLGARLDRGRAGVPQLRLQHLRRLHHVRPAGSGRAAAAAPANRRDDPAPGTADRPRRDRRGGAAPPGPEGRPARACRQRRRDRRRAR